MRNYTNIYFIIS